MSETNYPGIDYSGPGSTKNRNSETGIRYGIISQNSLDPDVSGEIGGNGWRDLGFENAEAELKDNLRHALSDYYQAGSAAMAAAVEDAFDALDGWAENIESSWPYALEEDGLKLQTMTDSPELWVFESPFYTYAQFCSPCMPGACNLDSPLAIGDLSDTGPYATPDDEVLVRGSELTVEQLRRDRAAEDLPASNKCYCLPHSWFEGSKAPYRVFRVDNNEEVLP